MTSDRRARAFKIVFPAIDCYFSGTGDMFAALMVVRMREAVWNTPGLSKVESWRSGDEAGALELPLAKAAEKVLASMHEVLAKTSEAMDRSKREGMLVNGDLEGDEERERRKKMAHLQKTKAAELRLVRHLESLKSPTVEFRAVKM